MNHPRPAIFHPTLVLALSATALALTACAISATVALESRAPARGATAARDHATATQDRVLTPHNVATLCAVSAAAISPDGKRVAFLRLVPRNAGVDEDGAPWSELWVMDVEDGRERAFVTGKVDVSSVKWTPDGSRIAFLTKRGEDNFTSLYVIPADGGEASRAVALGSNISTYSFSPDGRRVALVAPDPEDEAKKKLQDKGFKQEVYEEDARFSKVWVARLDADFLGNPHDTTQDAPHGTPRDTPQDTQDKPRALPIEGQVYQVHWSPADDRLLVTVAPTPLVDDEYMRQHVRVVDPLSGEVIAKIENPGKIGAVAWSPDAKRIALIAGGDLHDPSAGRLTVCSAEGGVPVDLLPRYEGDFSSVAWQDADTVMYIGSQGVWSTFGKVDVGPAGASGGSSGAQGKREHKQILGPGGSGAPTRSGASKAPTNAGGPILSAFTLSKDGMRAAFVASTPTHAPELYTMSHGDAGPKRRTSSNPWLDEMRFAPQEVVKWKARDGVELEGILVRPLDEEKGRRYPLILCMHGGPEAHEQNGWQTGYSKPGQIAAARGMATFYPNYRGSTGRGIAFSKLSQGDPAGKEFDDLVDAVDHFVATGLADKSRVGVTGGSYGGYATGWCSTRYSDRFAAGVMFVGISDKVSKVGTTDIPNEDYLVHLLKRPWDDWQMMLERSPIYYAGQCKTPLIILHGKDDPRVNPGQSRELYRHLKLHGQAPVRLVMYPGEGHGNRKAATRLDYCLRMMQWMEHYLVGPGGEMPPYEIDYGDPAAQKATAAVTAASR